MTQPFLLAEGVWIPVRDANPTGLALFHRHYSYKPYRDGRKPKHFVGPGEKMVLLTPCARALFVWRKFISGDGQQGVNCAVFRNEGAGLSSDLIREADRLAWVRWPGQRHFTYVNAAKVRSRNPGYCFLMAGWKRCGVTKWRRLLIFEIFAPEAAGSREAAPRAISTPAGSPDCSTAKFLAGELVLEAIPGKPESMPAAQVVPPEKEDQEC